VMMCLNLLLLLHNPVYSCLNLYKRVGVVVVGVGNAYKAIFNM
jgi:hypothetical protein